MVRQGARGVRGRVAGTALVVAAGLTLTGCGDVSPGAAATVDGTAIARDTVDEIAQSVCAAEVEYAELTEQQFSPGPPRSTATTCCRCW